MAPPLWRPGMVSGNDELPLLAPVCDVSPKVGPVAYSVPPDPHSFSMPCRWQVPSKETGDWHAVFVVFNPRPHWLTWLNALDFRDGIAMLRSTGESQAELESAILRVVDAYRARGPLRDEESLCYLELLLIRICAALSRGEADMDSRVRLAVEFIQSHLAEPVTGPQIAARASLSVARLRTLFGASLGISPGEYLERARLSRAAEALRFSHESICAVASAVGYADQTYFTRRFRLLYGQTPTQYRNASRPNRRDAGC